MKRLLHLLEGLVLVFVVEALQAALTVDKQGKGFAIKTILRNLDARELFHQHGLSYQQRQQQSKRLKQKRSQLALDPETRVAYRGLHTSELTASLRRERLGFEISAAKHGFDIIASYFKGVLFIRSQ